MKAIVICTECPIGCTVSVEHEGDTILAVSGNGCPRGKKYASDEVVCPRRTVTSTVRTKDGRLVSVKTSSGVPKSEIFAVMKKIRALHTDTPIRIGDILLADISADVDLVATSDLK